MAFLLAAQSSADGHWPADLTDTTGGASGGRRSPLLPPTLAAVRVGDFWVAFVCECVWYGSLASAPHSTPT